MINCYHTIRKKKKRNQIIPIYDSIRIYKKRKRKETNKKDRTKGPPPEVGREREREEEVYSLL